MTDMFVAAPSGKQKCRVLKARLVAQLQMKCHSQSWALTFTDLFTEGKQ